MSALDIIGLALESVGRVDQGKVDREKVDPVDRGRSVESTAFPLTEQRGRPGRPGRSQKTASREQSEQMPRLKRWRITVQQDDGSRSFDMLTPASYSSDAASAVARFHFSERLISTTEVSA